MNTTLQAVRTDISLVIKAGGMPINLNVHKVNITWGINTIPRAVCTVLPESVKDKTEPTTVDKMKSGMSNVSSGFRSFKYLGIDVLGDITITTVDVETKQELFKEALNGWIVTYITQDETRADSEMTYTVVLETPLCMLKKAAGFYTHRGVDFVKKLQDHGEIPNILAAGDAMLDIVAEAIKNDPPKNFEKGYDYTTGYTGEAYRLQTYIDAGGLTFPLSSFLSALSPSMSDAMAIECALQFSNLAESAPWDAIVALANMYSFVIVPKLKAENGKWAVLKVLNPSKPESNEVASLDTVYAFRENLDTDPISGVRVFCNAKDRLVISTLYKKMNAEDEAPTGEIMYYHATSGGGRIVNRDLPSYISRVFARAASLDREISTTSPSNEVLDDSSLIGDETVSNMLQAGVSEDKALDAYDELLSKYAKTTFMQLYGKDSKTVLGRPAVGGSLPSLLSSVSNPASTAPAGIVIAADITATAKGGYCVYNTYSAYCMLTGSTVPSNELWN